jgi:hypothetical protein
VNSSSLRWDDREAGFVAPSKEKFGDEECAKQEENRNAQIAEQADIVEPVVRRWVDRNKVHPMDDKNNHEGNESENIEFWPIVAADTHSGAGTPFL